jgi:hypothetical protein
MKRYEGVYHWNGWGGKLRLASGSCMLWIFDFANEKKDNLMFLKPILAITRDVPKKSPSFGEMSIRSCAGHIATSAVREFGIDPQRMLWVEHYPQTRYGSGDERLIEEAFFLTDFEWSEGRALNPERRRASPGIADQIRGLLKRGAL